MALIICKKCGEMISDKAKRCPHCVKKEYSRKENNLHLVLIILGIIIVALIMMTTIR